MGWNFLIRVLRALSRKGARALVDQSDDERESESSSPIKALCSLLVHFDDDCFINKAQFDAGFADRLMLKDGAVPAIKVHGRELKPQAVSNCVKCLCVLLAIGA